MKLLTGQDIWSTYPQPQIGLRSMILSDGPAGVRGPVWGERCPSLNLPNPTALASSWDPTVAYRFGTAVAHETIRKGVDVVLGPTIKIHRSPLNDRHFEAFSEDPLLTADLAEGFVRGVQDPGVGATPKHYVANDSETERFTVDVRVGDRALHEVYLAAFEKPVVEGHAWAIMSAYSSINGDTMTENELLTDPLGTKWGFHGVIVSDWAAVRTLRSAEHPQDLVMPGPEGPWGEALVEAVRNGKIAEDVVNEKVIRILRLAARPAADLIADAAAAASDADAAIVVVGTNAEAESEGYDRTSLALPGEQDRLVSAVSAAIPRTVVMVNAGAPVEMPWRDEVAAVLIPYFGGQEMGGTIGDILSGKDEPGGRLTTTWPVKLDDCPSANVTPEGGRLSYGEGTHAGYKGRLRGGMDPAYPFGLGLGYTDFTLELLSVEGSFAADDLQMHLRVSNTGDRAYKAVTQLYVEMPDSAVERPVRWLVGFDVAHVATGETQEITIAVPRRQVEYWDGAWVFEPDEYLLRAGWNVAELSGAAAAE